MSALWIRCQVIGVHLYDVCAFWSVFVKFVWCVLCVSVRRVYSSVCECGEFMSEVCALWTVCGVCGVHAVSLCKVCVQWSVW